MEAKSVRRSVRLTITVTVESAPEAFASEVLRRVETALYSGLEHAECAIYPHRVHEVQFGTPVTVWDEDEPE